MSQQEHDITKSWKRNFNIAFSLCLMHQRALTVPMRNQYGVQALGTPCAFAVALMLVWHMATQDPFMLVWLGVWLLYYIKRRVEAMKLAKSGAKIMSRYDGWPFDGLKFVKSEYAAKRFAEPILCGILGGILFWLYTENGLRPTGLPYFFLLGVFSLPSIEAVKKMAWDKRIEGMHDARIEQEMAVEDYRNRYGE